MAVTLLNASGFQWGVASDETGINIESFTTDVAPEFRDKLPKKDGTIRSVAVAPAMVTVKIKGEISGNTGVMAGTFIIGIALANTIAYFGAPASAATSSASAMLLTKGTITEKRNGWKDLDAEYEGYSGLTNA